MASSARLGPRERRPWTAGCLSSAALVGWRTGFFIGTNLSATNYINASQESSNGNQHNEHNKLYFDNYYNIIGFLLNIPFCLCDAYTNSLFPRLADIDDIFYCHNNTSKSAAFLAI